MVYIILAEGFEETEAIATADVLIRGGAELKLAGVGADEIKGAHGITVKTDVLAGNVEPGKKDYIIVPGGLGGVEQCEKSGDVTTLLLKASAAGAVLCAICAGPRALASLGLLSGRSITCYPGMEKQMTGAAADCSKSTAVDGDRITCRAPGSSIDFGLEILRDLKGAKTAERVAKEMHYPYAR